MSMYETCPQLWYYRYIQKIPMFKGPALFFGSNVHSLIEADLKGVKSNVSLKSFSYDKRDPEESFEKAKLLRDRGMETLHSDPDLMFPGLNAITNDDIEWRFMINKPGFRGFIDLKYRNQDGDGFIIDWKTTSVEYTQHDIASAPQLTAYAWAYHNEFKELPRAVCFITLDKVTKVASVYIGRRDLEDITEYQRRVNLNYQAMKEQIAFKRETGCDTQYGPCQFKKECWAKHSAEVVVKPAHELPDLQKPAWY